MRKCDACGYLLFGDAEACKHCGTALVSEASPELVTAGAPVAAHAPIAPPAPMIDRTFASQLPPPELGRVPVGREYWSPERDPVITTKPKSSRGGLLALIVLVSMAFGWVSVGRVLHGDSLPSGTGDFVAGRGVSFASPDRTFEARFPSTPTVEQKQIPVASSSATMNLAQVQTDSYEIVAASMVLPISIPPGQLDRALHEILNEGVAATNGKVESEKPVVVSGVTGLEVRAKVSDGYGARVMVLSSGNRIFMLGVHSKQGTDRLYDALVTSFFMH